MLFPDQATPSSINKFCENTMISLLGIQFTEVGKDFIRAKMPVNDKTRQPIGLLHGGASVTLAESLGSVAAHIIVAGKNQHAVGLQINANHIRSVKKGFVVGTVSPIHIGKSTHIWEIKIEDEQNQLVAVSRITMAILDTKNNK